MVPSSRLLVVLHDGEQIDGSHCMLFSEYLKVYYFGGGAETDNIHMMILKVNYFFGVMSFSEPQMATS